MYMHPAFLQLQRAIDPDIIHLVLQAFLDCVVHDCTEPGCVQTVSWEKKRSISRTVLYEII